MNATRELVRQSEAKRKQAPQSEANVCRRRRRRRTCNREKTSLIICTGHPIMHRTPNTNYGLRSRASTWYERTGAVMALTYPIAHGYMRLWKLIYISSRTIKTESIRKLSNFNFQWTKTLYQNNFKHITFFFTFFKSYRCNVKYQIYSPRPHEKLSFNWCYYRYLVISIALEKFRKECDIVSVILVQGFCPLKIKITQFPNRFRLNFLRFFYL